MPDASKPTARRGHESDDIAGGRIAWTAAGLVTSLIVVAFAAWSVLMLVRSGQPPLPSARDLAPRMPAPQLQSAPARDLQSLREEKHAMLNSYRWLDRSAGVVQIPIDRAMQLMAARPSASRDNGKTSEAPR